MKNIQPFTKERLGKETERIKRIKIMFEQRNFPACEGLFGFREGFKEYKERKEEILGGNRFNECKNLGEFYELAEKLFKEIDEDDYFRYAKLCREMEDWSLYNNIFFGCCTEEAVAIVAKKAHDFYFSGEFDENDLDFLLDASYYDERMRQMREYCEYHFLNANRVESLLLGTSVEYYSRIRRSIYWGCRTADEIEARYREMYSNVEKSHQGGRGFLEDVSFLGNAYEYKKFIGLEKKH